ncbi:hypothetical protein ACFSTC_14880 [Nonomuraea ferruginea]
MRGLLSQLTSSQSEIEAQELRDDADEASATPHRRVWRPPPLLRRRYATYCHPAPERRGARARSRALRRLRRDRPGLARPPQDRSASSRAARSRPRAW